MAAVQPAAPRSDAPGRALSADPPEHAGTTAAEPLTVATSAAPVPEAVLSRRTLILRVFALAVLVAVVATVGGGLAARSLAESEAVHAATVRTDDIARDVVQPLLTGRFDPGSTAFTHLDDRIRGLVVGRDVVRVKIWSATGTIVYSDEPRLIGRTFGIDEEEQRTLASGGSQAEISDLSKPENRYERGSGPLLEVYRAVRAADGTPLLFETYYRYGDVANAATRIWTGFAGLIGASLLLLLGALLPLLNGLVRTVERAREERELSLLKALDASDAERRRIAAAVHDGPVQDLIGAAYRLGAASADVRGTELEPLVEAAERAVRESVEGLRDTLVDLYPSALAESGVAGALGDLVAGARARGAIVLLRVEDDLTLPADEQRLLFRVARETIANAGKHGGGTPVQVDVRRQGASVVLTVRDGGPGFDAAAMIGQPPAGHFGLRLLQDAVRESGVDAVLTLSSAPGAGTVWRLVLDVERPALTRRARRSRAVRA